MSPSGGLRRARAAPLVVATAGHVLAISAQSTFIFFLVPAFTRATGLTHLDVAAFALGPLVTMLVGLPAGRFADARGRRPVLRAGWWMIAAGAASLAPPLAWGAPFAPAWLFAGVALTQAGLACAWVAFMSYVADLKGGASLARSYGAATGLLILASAAGPFAGAALVASAGSEAAGLARVAAFLGGLGAAAALFSYALPSVRGPDSSALTDPWRFVLRPRSRVERSVFGMNVAFLGIGLSYGATVPYLAGHFLDRVGVSTAAWGALLGLGTALGAGAAWGAGALVARFGARALVLPVVGGVALALVALPWVALPLVAGALFVARQAIGSATGTVINSALMEGVSADARGEVLGASVLTWNLGWGAGALAGGLALAAWGAVALVPAALAGVAGAAVGLAIARRA